MNRHPQPAIDHLVFACSDLETGVSLISDRLGATPVGGGRHPAWGTHNSLLGLGERCYLEVIAPDPEAGTPEQGTPAVFSGPDPGKLTTWAVAVGGLSAERLTQSGVDRLLGSVHHGSRELGDGTRLEWSLTDPARTLHGGTVPFLIDWGESRHPAESLAPGCRLLKLELQHPEPALLQPILDRLHAGTLVSVSEASEIRIRAAVESPNGTVWL